jgi:hypothetical protein
MSDEFAKQSGENVHYNHRTRRKYAKDFLRSQKKVIVDHNGKERVTNELKEIKKKERYSLKNWFERVNRSQEYGSQIKHMNKETQYQNLIKENEERDAKWLQSLIEIHGEDEGMRIHKEHWEKKAKNEE